LWKRPWFTRVWVVQEASSSQNTHFIIGDEDLPFETLLNGLSLSVLRALTATVFGSSISKGSVEAFNNAADMVHSIYHLRKTLAAKFPEVSENGQNGSLYEKTLNLEFAEATNCVGQLLKGTETLEDNMPVPGLPLMEVLNYVHRLQSTYPRDKLYASTLLSSDAADAPRPDYRISETKVFLQYALYLIGKGYGIELLYRALACEAEMKLPSWIPDWSSSPKRDLLRSALRLRLKAAIDREARISRGDDLGTIIVEGAFVDKVAMLGPPSSEFISSHHISETDLEQAFKLMSEGTCCCGTDGSSHPIAKAIKDNNLHIGAALERPCLSQWIRAFSILVHVKYKAQTAARSDDIFNIEDENDIIMQEILEANTDFPLSYYDPVEALFFTIFEAISAPALQLYLSSRAPGLTSLEDIEHRLARDQGFLRDFSKALIITPNFKSIMTILSSYRFCVTTQGRTGFVRDNVKEGDEIVVFSGSPTLFILRKIQGADTFTLQSDAYIRGLMNGEALQEERLKPSSISLV
jgi:hypothetical protein